MLEGAITPALERGSCPHLAVLLRSKADLPAVLASFYALGAQRGGWMAHRSVRGEADDDRRLLAEAGLDVAGLEAAERLAIVESDPEEAPEQSADPWVRALEAALGRGLSALWYSRFAVGPQEEQYRAVLAFERAWEECFHDRPVVTLCPYLVGELDGAATLERLDGISSLHDGVLIPSTPGELGLWARA
jgi:hypothetical protein